MKKILIFIIFTISLMSCEKEPEPVKLDTFKGTLVLEAISGNSGDLTVFPLYEATLDNKEFKFPTKTSSELLDDKYTIDILNGSVLNVKNIKGISVDSTFVRMIYFNTNKVVTLFRCKGRPNKLILTLVKP